MLKKLLFLTIFLSQTAFVFAQKEGQNWYFGVNAAVSFANGGPVSQMNSAMNTYEACASISDGTGNLLFYTNSVNVWNRNHQLMSNGLALGGHESASQGAFILKRPGSASQYYIFVVDACDNLLQGGLKYSVVDMSRQGGLGEVTSRSVQLSTGMNLTEKLTVVPHANGTDSWVLVHGWMSNSFYAYLVTATGISTTPVSSAIGKVHEGGGGNFGNANAVGYLKASLNGRKLALGIRDANFELFDFDNASGRVSNYVPLAQFYRSYGVEFSPDGSRLYGSTLDGNQIYQFNLLAGSSAAIVASATPVGSSSGFAGALQLGPDSKLYVAQYNRPSLSVINNPNNLGAACGFQRDAVSLGGRLCQIGLPNGQMVAAVPVAAITASAVCVETPTTFQAVIQNAPGATLTWNFGEPASGVANAGSGANVVHTYLTAGTFTATLTLTGAGLSTPLVVTRTVTVNAAPVINLGPARQLCAGQGLTLTAGVQPNGTTYRWQDGSDGASFMVQAAGTYTLTVTSAQGCTATSSTTVTLSPIPVVSLGRDTTLCLTQPLLLRPNPQPTGATYRWQDGSTSSSYVVLNPGTYSVTVTQPGGCSTSDEVVIFSAQCQFTIPNIITPNHDQQNEAFVLKGLNPTAWELTVFNRWGRQIYQKAGYDNSWNAEGQPDGAYFYLLRNSTTAQQYRGWVQVVR